MKQDVAINGTNRIPVQIRHQQIMNAFGQNDFISVTEIAEELGVSTMTIRRDLVTLERSGKILRTHGGAVASKENTNNGAIIDNERSFDSRMNRQQEAKQRIAKAASKLVKAGQSVGLDTGSTVLAAAQELAQRNDILIFTTDLRSAQAQAESKNRLYVVGGEVHMPELSVIGLTAIDTVLSHYLDFVFLGVSAIDECGIYDFSPEVTEVKKAFIRSASKVVVLCDSEKFGIRALTRIVDLEPIDVLVTDIAPPESIYQKLLAANVEVIIAQEV